MSSSDDIVASMSTEWWERAACRGDDKVWVWANQPSDPTVDDRLSTCASCPVVKACRQDLVQTGDAYPYQVRGGLRLWTADADQLPSMIQSYTYVPPKRAPGRPSTNPYSTDRRHGWNR